LLSRAGYVIVRRSLFIGQSRSWLVVEWVILGNGLPLLALAKRRYRNAKRVDIYEKLVQILGEQ
jgi:hypothetical protein